MQKLVFINGNGTQIDLTAGNFGIVNWAGLSNTSLNIQTQQVPFEDGGVFLDALMEQREIEVTVAIYDGNNLELRYQKKRELISALNPKLGEGTLIYTNDYLSRQIKAVPQIPLFENKNSNDVGTLKASVAFSCPSPYWEDLEDTEILLNAGESVSINNEGDVPTGWEAKIFANDVDNPFIRNNTTNEVLEIEGENITKQINIDVNLGKKTVIEEKTIARLIKNGIQINDIAYKDNKAVIVGNKGLIIVYDFNTNECIRKETEFNEDIFCICYSEEKDAFIAIGDKGYGYISTNLDEWNSFNIWTSVSSSRTDAFRDVEYNEYYNVFIAVGDFGAMAKSEDGTTWIDISITNTHSNSFYAVACEPSQGITVAVRQSRFLYCSNDLNTWADQTVSSGLSSDVIFTNVVYDKNISRFIITGYPNDNNNLVFRSNIASSTGWALGSGIPVSNSHIISIESSYATKSVVFILSNGEMYKSTDGLYYYYIGQVETQNIKKLSYCVKEGLWNILTTDGIALKSSDLKNWDEFITKLPSINFIDICYAKDKNIYVALEQSGISAKVLYSKDGIKWDSAVLPNTSLPNRIKYIKELGKFFIIGESGLILDSINAINWNIRNSGITESLQSIAYNPTIGKLVILSYSGTTVLKSINGEIWTASTVASLTGIRDMIYSVLLGKLVAVGDHICATSEDAENWAITSVNVNLKLIIESVVNKVLIRTTANIINYSYDGINWLDASISIGTATINNGGSNEYTGEIYIVTTKGTFQSAKGLSWTFTGTVLGDYLKGITFNKESVIVIGIYNLSMQEKIDSANVINKISANSKLFELRKGINNIIFSYASGTANAVLIYRQKYIGV